jgi:hypothetical protein
MAKDYDKSRAELDDSTERLTSTYVDRMHLNTVHAINLLEVENIIHPNEALNIGSIDGISGLDVPFESSIYVNPTPKLLILLSRDRRGCTHAV